MKVHKVQSYKAFATSMRHNGKEGWSDKGEADINIEIIDGKRKLQLLPTDLHHLLNRSNLSFVDVGGGVEFTLFSNGKS
jgi:hypothetical protein